MIESFTFLSTSADQTQGFGRDWGKDLQGGTVVGLIGPLGAGKTCFSKGVISGLSRCDPEEITSPTFTLMEEYRSENIIYHVDLYRLVSPHDAEALPIEDWFAPQVITLIEWPERVPDLILDCHFLVQFSKEGEETRRINIEKRKS